jgi:PAS domain S-box-containing protein
VLISLFPVELPFLIYFTAIAISAWLGGMYSGILATALSAVIADFLFIRPFGSLTLESSHTIYLLVFCGEGLLIAAFSSLLHRAYNFAIEENTLHTRTEQSLRESEERFRLLVEGVQDYAIFMLDPDGIITLWNSGAERIKGYTSEEIVGKPLASLYPPEELEKGMPYSLMQRAIKEGSAEIEGWRMRKDGTRFWANVTLTSLWKDGELRGFAKITRDMTERRRAEALAKSLEMERVARQEAERANQLKTRFLAMISHELRTPLTSMKGFTTSLLSEDVVWTPEQQHQFLEIIDQEADKLRELIDQLLNLSQIEAGVLQIRKASQPFSASLDMAQEELRVLTRNHNFRVEIPGGLRNVVMDERRVAQVIVNLVGNAAKYSPEGTVITLSATAQDDVLQVEVHDQGPGIPANQRTSVFEAFNQLERKVNPRDGAGLGLAIAKGLVTAQGGKIWVKDGVSEGTTMVFTLPLTRADGEQISLENNRV